MFLLALLFIFSGFPVAFALGGTALVFIPLGIWLGYFDFSWMQALPQQVFGIMGNYTLLAVPFFIFMGTMLEKSGLAEDLLKTMGQLFGRLRGGLALSSGGRHLARRCHRGGGRNRRGHGHDFLARDDVLWLRQRMILPGIHARQQQTGQQ